MRKQATQNPAAAKENARQNPTGKRAVNLQVAVPFWNILDAFTFCSLAVVKIDQRNARQKLADALGKLDATVINKASFNFELP